VTASQNFVLHCDQPGCRAVLNEGFSAPQYLRQSAKRRGWQVAIDPDATVRERKPAFYGEKDKRLDYCPQHREEAFAVKPRKK